MLDQNDLQAIAQLMDMKLKPINERLDSMDERLNSMDERLSNLEEDVETIKEDTQITREATNTLLEWAEQAQVEVKIPLYRKAE